MSPRPTRRNAARSSIRCSGPPGRPRPRAGRKPYRRFGSLPAALAVGTTIGRVRGREAARFLPSIQAGLLHCLRLPLAKRPVVSTSRQLLDYLRADMTNLITSASAFSSSPRRTS